MPTELAPSILALALLVLGTSCLVQTRRWLGLWRSILEKPERFFLGALVELLIGLTLALTYNRWDTTWPTFTTLIGWLMALEGAAFLLAPSLFQKFNRLSDGFIRSYLRIGGIILIVLGALLGQFALSTA
jgi:uncharacterized protein YjeT (DUF2065 family)